MLIDLHAHSGPLSPCCRIPYDKVLEEALAHGMDGIVLTNHYQKSNMKEDSLESYVEKYIDEYYRTEAYGRKIGCRVFFGVEVTMERYPKVHMLLYGIDPEYLRAHPDLFDLTQKELYELTKAGGGIMVQAHPFRNGTTVLDPAYLDGVEINCHPIYKKSYAQELIDIAEKEHLLLTCGGDYHADTYRPKCGMILPDELVDHKDLCRYLSTPGEKSILMQEVNASECESIQYSR